MTSAHQYTARPAALLAALALSLLALTSCDFSTMTDNPPSGSLASLDRLRLPSLTFTDMQALTSSVDSGLDVGKLSLRAYENNGTMVPTGPVLQETLAAFKIRGESSSGWPKKSMNLELRDSSDVLQAKNMEFLGLPSENDFILHAIWSDKSLVRNLLIYRLAGEIQDWAPRTRLVELWGAQPGQTLATTYQGIYLLVEKIKVDKNRVNVTPLSASDNDDTTASGGYIFRVDKASSDYSIGTKTRNLTVLEPKAEALSSEQRTWLTTYFTNLEASFRSYPEVDDWRSYVDEDSFIDFLLLNELMMNVDGFRLSTYMHKDRGGKLKAGPVWDFDLSSGNDWRCIDPAGGWEILSQLDPNFNDFYPPFWWSEMFHDADFRTAVKARWTALRGSTFSDAHIESVIDDAIDEASPAITRNFVQWPSLTSNDDTFWTPMPIPGDDSDSSAYTQANHLAWLKRWLKARTAWLDSAAAWQALEDFAANSSLHLDQGGNL